MFYFHILRPVAIRKRREGLTVRFQDPVVEKTANTEVSRPKDRMQHLQNPKKESELSILVDGESLKSMILTAEIKVKGESIVLKEVLQSYSKSSRERKRFRAGS